MVLINTYAWYWLNAKQFNNTTELFLLLFSRFTIIIRIIIIIIIIIIIYTLTHVRTHSLTHSLTHTHTHLLNHSRSWSTTIKQSHSFICSNLNQMWCQRGQGEEEPQRTRCFVSVLNITVTHLHYARIFLLVTLHANIKFVGDLINRNRKLAAWSSIVSAFTWIIVVEMIKTP